MRVERALLEELPEKKFNIGYQGELNHTQVIISCPIMFRDYPDAVASMVVKPPQGDLYPVSLTRDGNDLTWDVSDADVAIPGEGILQLTFTDGEGDDAEVIKTVFGAYSVNGSLMATGEAPDPVQSWLDEAGAALATFETEVGEIRKITTATTEDEGKALSPKTVVNGKVTEWEYIDTADPEAIQEAVDNWLDDHPEATTTVEDGAITEAKLNDSLKADLAWKDDVDGLMSAIKRPEFIVGNAEEVLSDRGETDETVYLFRKTGGGTKKAYNREQVRKIVGGTVAWNQLAGTSNVASQSSSNVDITLNNDHSYTLSGTANGRVTTNLNVYDRANFKNGHKYAIIMSENTSSIKLRASSGLTPGFTSTSTIAQCTADTNMFFTFDSLTDISGTSINISKLFCQFVDLTAALGSTIADYLHTLETQTAGSGVALFRSLFDKSYYAYNAGSLESVNVSEHRLTGKNLVKLSFIGIYNLTTGQPNQTSSSTYASTEKIMCNGDTDYVGSASFTITQMLVYYWDANGNYIQYDVISNSPWKFTTPSNAKYVAVTFRKSSDSSSLSDFQNVQLEFGESASAFEPYQLYTYPMPNVTLRGIPKLVNGEIVFDGDELLPDGTVKRRYGIKDLSTLNWVYSLGCFSTNQFDVKTNGALICTKYTWNPTTNVLPENVADKEMTASPYFNSKTIYIKDSAYSDADTFKASLSGTYLVYELNAEGTESVDGYQELQVCNRYGTEEYVDRLATAETSPRDVAIPCGHETFYPVNVFDYIDEHLTASQTLMELIVTANREEAMKATKAYSTGNLIIVNGTLYRATTSIANGANLTVGTNVTATTIATELANLA